MNIITIIIIWFARVIDCSFSFVMYVVMFVWLTVVPPLEDAYVLDRADCQSSIDPAQDSLLRDTRSYQAVLSQAKPSHHPAALPCPPSRLTFISLACPEESGINGKK